MRRFTRLAPIFLLAASQAACVLRPDVVGEGLSDDSPGGGVSVTCTTAVTSGEAQERVCEGTTDGGTTHPESTTYEPPPLGPTYGEPCELLGLSGPIQITAITPQPACAGGICLFMQDDIPPDCAGDADCAAPYRTCAPNHRCAFDPGFVAAEARCTHGCSEDADCPAVPGCDSGVSCVAVARIGELCCEKVCACDDARSVSESQYTETLCGSGNHDCG